jgi:hypothetical protein
MRAATAIVGAIAVASILIALSFVVSDGSSSPKAATKTVTEFVQAPTPKNEAAADEEGATEPEESEAAKTHFGGPAACNGGEFTVENVSCEIGAQIQERHEEGESGSLLAQTPSETISMTCAGTAPVECKGPGGARVYFEK